MDSDPPINTQIVNQSFSNLNEESGLLKLLMIPSWVLVNLTSILTLTLNYQVGKGMLRTWWIIPPRNQSSFLIPRRLIDAAHGNFLNNRNTIHNKGPYIVSAQTIAGGSFKHSLSMGKFLRSTFSDLIKNIEKADGTKILVEYFNGKSADKDSLAKFNLEAHIPNHRISREGIICNVPLDILYYST